MYTDASCKNAHDFSTPVTKDITLYAKWTKNKIAVGAKIESSAGKVKVTSVSKKTVALTKAKNKKTVTVPAYVTIEGQKYRVTSIAANAFKGTKAKTVVVKTKNLTKKSVKNSLKGFKVKTVKVKVGNKTSNKKFVKKYKKIFTKKNAGKKVTVK